MAVAFTNNWKNILDKLRSVLRAEYGNTLPVYIGDEDTAASSQYIRLDPQSSELMEYSVSSEMREYTINIFYMDIFLLQQQSGKRSLFYQKHTMQ